MPSPQQSPERARLRAFIERQAKDLDMSWADLERASGVPYETIRRVRMGDRPISKDVRDRLEDGLRWRRGSIRRVLEGGDPTALGEYTITQERHTLDTPVGEVFYDVMQSLDADTAGFTEEERSELERALAERIRSEVTVFVESKRAQIERRRSGSQES